MSLDVVGIRRPVKYEEIFQLYGSQQSDIRIESSPFISMKDLCMIAGVLGYNKRLYIEDFKRDSTTNAIKIGIFQRRDIEVIKMIALLHEKDIKVLDNPRRVAEIFESYICGGIGEIIDILSDEDNIGWDYLQMIMSNM